MRGEEQCYLVHRLLMCVCVCGGGGSKCVINILGSGHLVFKSCTYSMGSNFSVPILLSP